MGSETFKSQDRFFGRILLVEDDPVMARWIGTSLSRNSIETIWHNSFDTAKVFLSNTDNVSQIHAVIADIYLQSEQPTGVKILERCQQLEIPAGVITSKLDLDIARNILKQSALFLLEKPFDINDLISALMNAWQEPKFLNVVVERSMEVEQLTAKEKEVCRLIIKGLTNKEIAQTLNVTEKTVKFHVTSILNKFEVESRSELQSHLFPT